MKKYHMTENRYLNSILNHGLTPQRGVRNQLINNPKCAVFYSEGYEGALATFFKIAADYVRCKPKMDEEKYFNEYNQLKNQFKKVLSVRQVRKHQELLCRLRKSKRIYKARKRARMTKNFMEFLGEGVYLSLENVNPEKCFIKERTLDNSWTLETVEPQNINVVVLQNKESGQILSSKYDVLMFFASQVPLGELKERIKNEKPQKGEQEDKLLLEIASRYYSKHAEKIQSYGEKYIYREIPIREYMKKKDHENKEGR